MNRLIVSASGYGSQSGGTTFGCLICVTDEEGNPVTELTARNFVLYSEVNNSFVSPAPAIFTQMKTANVIDHGAGFYHVDSEAAVLGGAAVQPVVPTPSGPVGLAVTQFQIEETGPIGKGGTIKFVPIASGSLVFTAG